MKFEKRVKLLNGFLNVIVTTIVILLSFYFYGLFAEEFKVNNILLNIIFNLIFLGGHIMMILSLKKILKSIRNKDPFSSDNILHFRKIGYYILIVGTVYAIATYSDANYSGLTIIGTSYGSIKPISILYLILSILSFILSDVFRIAMEIKDENDLTI